MADAQAVRLPPERPGVRRFRLARIFDGTAPNGRPSVNRPPVSDDDRERLLEYLDHAALALPERGHDVTGCPDGRPTVPVAFHTDGVWVWPAAVNYYLRRYGVPPDPDLVNHARSNGFRPPEVDEATRVGRRGHHHRWPAARRPPRPGRTQWSGIAQRLAVWTKWSRCTRWSGRSGRARCAGWTWRTRWAKRSRWTGSTGTAEPACGVPAPAMAGQGGPGITDLSSSQTTALAGPGAAAVAPPRPPPPAPMAAPEENLGGGAHSVAGEPEPVDRVETVAPVDEPAPPVAAPPIRRARSRNAR